MPEPGDDGASWGIRSAPARITLIYLLAGVLWIALSDRILNAVVQDPWAATWLQTAKGWTYVLATGTLLFVLVRRYAVHVERLMIDLMASEARYRRVIETTPNILRTSSFPALDTLFMSPAVTSVLGFEPSAFLVDRSLWRNQIHEDDRDRVLREMREQLNIDGAFSVQYRIRHSDGTTVRWVHEQGERDTDPNHPGHIVASAVTDVTRHRDAEQKADYLSNHDPLTGLLNQRAIHLLLGSLIPMAARRDSPLACLSIGIDRFRHINSTYGRHTGDEVLVRLAQKLNDTIRASDAVAHLQEPVVGRIGGDRFVVVMPDTDLAAAKLAAARLLEPLNLTQLTVGEQRVPITLKAGIVGYPVHGTDPATLISHAEEALDAAREPGAAAIRVLDLEKHRQETEAMRLLEHLHAALDEDRLVVHFQPILHIGQRKVHHVEALVRMEGADGSLTPPGPMIAVAERFGLIHQVDARVLDIVLAYLGHRDEHHDGVSVAVNLSGANINDPEFLQRIRRRLDETGVNPAHLIFEITETAAIADLHQAQAFMQATRALGCRFALDDFGIGFTSFSHLRTLPLDFVKIDGSFVRNIHKSRGDRGVVQAITQVVKAYDKSVIAEFVENAQILSLLAKMGVDYAQGFHIGKPIALTRDQFLHGDWCKSA